MASLALGVRFNPAAAGTADFVYSSVVTGYRDATVLVNSKTYRYRAESADLSQWEFGTGIWSSATNTLSRNTVSFSSTGAKVSFTVAPQVSIVINPDDVLQFDDAMTLTSVQQAQGRSNLAVPIQGYLFGLTLSTAGSSVSFGIAAGQAANSTAIDIMALASAYTKTTGAWAVGSGNGSLDSASIAANTWYHVYLIKRPDTGVVDVLISTNATTPTLPTNYTEFRNIGSMKTDGTSQWIKFLQIGDDFIWDVPVADASNVNPSGGVNYTLSVPLGKVVKSFTNIDFSSSSTGGYVAIQDPNTSAQAPNTPGGYFTLYSNVANLYNTGHFNIWTDTSSRIRVTGNGVGTPSLYIITMGWTDPRGRLS